MKINEVLKQMRSTDYDKAIKWGALAELLKGSENPKARRAAASYRGKFNGFLRRVRSQ